MSTKFFESMLVDLRRPHEFALERVGFAWGRWEEDAGDIGLILLHGFRPVEDDEYEDDPRVAVRIGAAPIRKAMQAALDGIASKSCLFHVHLHDFSGVPSPSVTDLREIPPVVESIARVSPTVPHGYMILAPDALSAWAMVYGDDGLQRVASYVCGSPSILHIGEVGH